jgi:hypothetical protein
VWRGDDEHGPIDGRALRLSRTGARRLSSVSQAPCLLPKVKFVLSGNSKDLNQSLYSQPLFEPRGYYRFSQDFGGDARKCANPGGKLTRRVSWTSRAWTSSDKESSEDFRRKRTPSIPGGWDASDENAGLRYRRISKLLSRLLVTARRPRSHRTPETNSAEALQNEEFIKSFVPQSSGRSRKHPRRPQRRGPDATPRGSNQSMENKTEQGRSRALQLSATKSTIASRARVSRVRWEHIYKGKTTLHDVGERSERSLPSPTFGASKGVRGRRRTGGTRYRRRGRTASGGPRAVFNGEIGVLLRI